MVYGCLSHRRLRAKNDGQANYVHEKIVGHKRRKLVVGEFARQCIKVEWIQEDTNAGENITIWKKKMTRSKLEFDMYY